MQFHYTYYDLFIINTAEIRALWTTAVNDQAISNEVNAWPAGTYWSWVYTPTQIRRFD